MLCVFVLLHFVKFSQIDRITVEFVLEFVCLTSNQCNAQNDEPFADEYHNDDVDFVCVLGVGLY